MQITFIFSDTPDLDELDALETVESKLNVPDEASNILNVEERIRHIGALVGDLSKASVHLHCPALGIEREQMSANTPDESIFSMPIPMTLQVYFSRGRQRRILGILAPVEMPSIRKLSSPRKKRKGRRSKNARLSDKLIPFTQIRTPDVAFDKIQELATHVEVLLNADNTDGVSFWVTPGFYPYWIDQDLGKRLQKQQQALKAKREQANKPSPKKSKQQKHGKGHKPGIAIPGEFQGVQMRSQLEIRCAAELEERGITWIYEPERLGKGNYLVDFHLPDHLCWIEVKGRVNARDKFLLADTAEALQERGETLFMYTSRRVYPVTAEGIGQGMHHADFWQWLDDMGEA